MKTLRVPLVHGLENMDFAALSAAMEANAARDVIDTVNWPDQFPYAPKVEFLVARSCTHIAVMYKVDGLDLRATAMQDYGDVYKDSCCEFFVSNPYDGRYYNIEMNCVGTILAGDRFSRSDSKPMEAEKTGRIIRHTSLERKPYDLEGEVGPWSVAMVVPFDVIGLDSNNLPASIRANFYKCGDLTAHVHFLSWNPIDAPKPDFHRPEFFGLLEF